MRGVISDGDLRRLLEREGGAALSKTAGEAMNAKPRTIAAERAGREGAGDSGGAEDYFAGGGGCGGKVEGVVHLHDLWGVELI